MPNILAMKRKRPKTKGGICQNPGPNKVGSEIPPMKKKTKKRPKPGIVVPKGGGLTLRSGAFVSVSKEELEVLLKADPKRFVVYVKP